MKQSTERILTTHAGSLPRTQSLVNMMISLSQRQEVDQTALVREIEESTRRVVRQQLAAGIDVGNNGEQARESFITYVQHRLSGYGGESNRLPIRDIVHFPSFQQLLFSLLPGPRVNLFRAPRAIGEVRHVNLKPIEAECRDFARIHGEQQGRFAEPFMTAASPGIVCAAMLNKYYPTDEEYVLAVAEALRREYEHIISQGLVLQVDCPDLALERHTSYANRPLEEFLRFVEMNISALNHALGGIPRDRVRMHVCWGNYEGPHIFDVPLDEILPLLCRANVGALFLPFANPRHAHEWRCLERFPLPEGMLLVAGVIDSTTNYVEHPEVVADRIERIARTVGDPTRILAGTDCGFATTAGVGMVAEEVVWEKLCALRAGADLATRRLFG